MFQDIVLNHKKTSLYTYGKNNEQDSFTFKIYAYKTTKKRNIRNNY